MGPENGHRMQGPIIIPFMYIKNPGTMAESPLSSSGGHCCLQDLNFKKKFHLINPPDFKREGSDRLPGGPSHRPKDPANSRTSGTYPPRLFRGHLSDHVTPRIGTTWNPPPDVFSRLFKRNNKSVRLSPTRYIIIIIDSPPHPKIR